MSVYPLVRLRSLQNRTMSRKPDSRQEDFLDSDGPNKGTRLTLNGSPVDKPAKFRHDCRPVHPECAALSSKFATCTCPLLWGYDLDIPKLRNAYVRLDLRTKWGRLIGRGLAAGPDQDEYSVWGVLDNLPTAASEPHPASDTATASSELEATGFWKEGEFLQTFVEMPTDCWEESLDSTQELEYPSKLSKPK